MLILLLFFNDRSYVLSFFINSIIHEFGHMAVAWIFGVKIKELRIDLFGARIALSNQGLSYAREALISLAGPFTNILAGVIGMLIMYAQADTRLMFFVLSNFSLALINFLPITSLDGGRILYALLQTFIESNTAERIIEILSALFLAFFWTVSVFLWFESGKSITLALFCMCLFARVMINREY